MPPEALMKDKGSSYAVAGHSGSETITILDEDAFHLRRFGDVGVVCVREF